ncbi:MAG: hypothetical protein IIA68_06015 [Proteobacteria bacterium]|nr:hypothetical protein [Pseudomonadota bacterium]
MIGADSSATLGDGAHTRTIEQPTERKIAIIGDKIIVAGTGSVGHSQRFVAIVNRLFTDKQFMNGSALATGKMLSQHGLKEFGETFVQVLDYTAFVAFEAEGQPVLCELPRGAMTKDQPTAFQPEIKDLGDLWFTSAGSGQHITDSFLALFKEIFWKDGPPNVRGGIFTALWALRHACEVNPGGIKEPVRIAVLAREKGKFRARMLDKDEKAEHENMVTAATDHMRGFLDVLEGKAEASEVPKPPQNA